MFRADGTHAYRVLPAARGRALLWPTTQRTAAEHSRRCREPHEPPGPPARPGGRWRVGSLALPRRLRRRRQLGRQRRRPTPPRPAPAARSKTIAFSPLALKIPAMKGLSEGVKGYGKSKGYEVIVQDPNLDPQKQVRSCRASSSPAGSAAPGSSRCSRPRCPAWSRRRRSKDIPLILNGTPEDYGLAGLEPLVSVLHHRLRRAGQGHRRGTRQLHQREARRQGRGVPSGRARPARPARRSWRRPRWTR